jgi:hypothetical protein
VSVVVLVQRDEKTKKKKGGGVDGGVYISTSCPGLKRPLAPGKRPGTNASLPLVPTWQYRFNIQY